MTTQSREAKSLSWPLGCDDLVYVHPDGRKIVYGDVVIVAQGYSACFSAGGEVYWFRDPQRYTIGYDNRTEAEILRGSIMGEDLDGLPLLVNTSLVFCRLRPLNYYTIKSDSYLMLNRMVGIQPEFRLRLCVEDDELLLQSVSLEARAIDQVLSAINACLQNQLFSLTRSTFGEDTAMESIRALLEDREWKTDFLEELRACVNESLAMGVAVEQLDVAAWNVWSGFCEECGAPVHPRAGRCPNMHRIRRCPVCGDQVYGGMCVAHHHDILFCPICNKYVVAQNGGCRTHPEIRKHY